MCASAGAQAFFQVTIQSHQDAKKKFLGTEGVVVVVQNKSVRVMHQVGVTKCVWWAFGAVEILQKAGCLGESLGDEHSTFDEKYAGEEAGAI